MGALVLLDLPQEMDAQASPVCDRAVVYKEVFMPYQTRTILTRAESFEPDLVYSAF